MAVPAAVQRQADKADQILKDNVAATTITAEDVEPTEPPVEPVEPPTEPPVEPPAPPAENYEHKYKVLQGKYNKEVPQLHDQLKSMSDKITSMETLIANMEAAPPAAPAEQLPGITDRDKDEFGEDLIELARRVARDEMGPKLQAAEERILALTAENATLKSDVGQVTKSVANDARTKLFSALDEQVADWRDLNTAPEFLDWLSLNDPLSGMTRQHLLTSAFTDNDTTRVVTIFKAYQDENAAITAAATAQSAQVTEPTVRMDTLVAPGKGREANVSAPKGENNPKQWHRSEITKFYDDVRKRKYVGREDEARKIEADIIAAGSSGRILN